MRDLRRIKKSGHQSRQRAFLREQNADALTIVLAEKLRGQRDDCSRLLGRIASNQKIDAVDRILRARDFLQFSFRQITCSGKLAV